MLRIPNTYLRYYLFARNPRRILFCISCSTIRYDFEMDTKKVTSLRINSSPFVFTLMMGKIWNRQDSKNRIFDFWNPKFTVDPDFGSDDLDLFLSSSSSFKNIVVLHSLIDFLHSYNYYLIVGNISCVENPTIRFTIKKYHK